MGQSLPLVEPIENDSTLSICQRALRAAQLVERSVVCGAADGSPGGRIAQPEPCSAESEALCGWWLGKEPAPGADLTRRTRSRPSACPRKQALEHAAWQRSSTRRRQAAARGIPEHVLRILCDAPQLEDPQRPAIERVENWAARNRRVLVLCGPNQVGKTYAAARWLERQPAGVFLPVRELPALATREAPDPPAWRRVLASPALVLDDVDDTLSDPQRVRIEELIVAAVTRMARVIVTTPLDTADALRAFRGAGRIGAASVGRIHLHGSVDVAASASGFVLTHQPRTP